MFKKLRESIKTKRLEGSKFSFKHPLVLLALFAVIGTALIISSRAATPEVEGRLLVWHDEISKDGKTHHLVETADNKYYKMELSEERLHELAGSKIRISGKINGNKIVPEREVEVIEPPFTPLVEEEQSGFLSPKLAHAATTTGSLKTAVILFKAKNSAAPSFTTTAAKSSMFTASDSYNAFFKENSLGKIALTGVESTTGDVFGWYTVDYTFTSVSQCMIDDWTLIAKANSAMMAAGHDPLAYHYRTYYFQTPSGQHCSAWGSLGGPVTWFSGSGPANTAHPFLNNHAHEFGHNLGLWHANYYQCYDSAGKKVSLSTNCLGVEYGDDFDVMGSVGDYRHFNNAYKGMLGWLNTTNTKTITTSGTYTIVPTETASTTGTQALRILKGTTTLKSGYPPSTVVKTYTGPVYYYLEYRRPYGFDKFASTDPVVNGVSVRLAPDYSATKMSELIDTTPGSLGTTFQNDYFDAPLAVGKKYYDASLKVLIETLSVSAFSATVKVTFNVTDYDGTPPSTPTSLKITNNTVFGGICLSWNPSTDAVGVTGYKLYRNGSLFKTLAKTPTSYCDKATSPLVLYSYQVSAFDANGNESVKSNSVSAKAL